MRHSQTSTNQPSLGRRSQQGTAGRTAAEAIRLLTSPGPMAPAKDPGPCLSICIHETSSAAAA